MVSFVHGVHPAVHGSVHGKSNEIPLVNKGLSIVSTASPDLSVEVNKRVEKKVDIEGREQCVSTVDTVDSNLRPWSPANPYSDRVAKRLSKLGGLHAPPKHQLNPTEELAINEARERADPGGFKREAFELMSKPALPF